MRIRFGSFGYSQELISSSLNDIISKKFISKRNELSGDHANCFWDS